ncbi:MAG: long-chain-fatty-acid--CoA ligase [Desulfobacteraceae bacterium]|nr:MAG: long-chain-fatty-acid--CoA ligase [Desulfobacteraceae bacterium]
MKGMISMERIGDFAFEVEMSRQLLLGEMLARNARKCPDVEGVIFKDRRITYRELDERVNRLANGLLRAGIRMGDSIGLIMENRREMLEIFFAAAKVGAVNVPVNTRLSPREMAYILNNADAKLLLFSGRFSETIARIKCELPSVGAYVLVDGQVGGTFQGYENFLATGLPIRPDVRLQDDQVVFIIYTAGTTGKPKGAMLTHKNLIVNAMAIMQETSLSLPRRAELPFLVQKVMSITPFFHIAGVLGIVKNMVTLTPMVIMEFDPLELLKMIERERVTFLFLVPAMWHMVMDHPDFKKYDVSSLRTAAYGADRIQNDTKKRILEAFPNAALYEAFGQTEMTANTVLMKHQDALRKDGSVGRPLFNVEFRVVDDEMNDVSVGEVGEIVYRGPGLFKGYYKNPKETEKAFEGGWFHSGDLVRQDSEGFIYVVDREKDMIISGGENIYSAEIEALLVTHPKIKEAAIIGVPDPKWGEAVKAFVVLEPGREATAEEIVQFCLENLARFKRPKFVEFLPCLPRSATGKILKRELRIRQPHLCPPRA